MQKDSIANYKNKDRLIQRDLLQLKTEIMVMNKSQEQKCSTLKEEISDLNAGLILANNSDKCSTSKSNLKSQMILYQNFMNLYMNLYKWQRETSYIRAFCTVTWLEGIFYWEFDKNSKTYKSTQMIQGGNENQHHKGEMSSNGIFVVGGYFNNVVKFYNMNTLNDLIPKIELLKTVSHTGNVMNCFVQNYTYVICIDKAGYAMKYDLISLEETNSFSLIGGSFRTGIETIDKHIIIGEIGKFHILDKNLNLLKSHEYSSTIEINEFAEVRKNILVTVDWISGCYLHDITDKLNPTTFKLLIDEEAYASIIALKSNVGDFAVGGKRIIDNLGLVAIYHLTKDSNEVIFIKSKERLPGDSSSCNISEIKELKSGSIIFGGTRFCLNICLWNYAASPEQELLCWPDQSVNNLYDFTGIPN